MKYQRGFLPFALYGVIAAGVVILGLGIALKVQSSRLDAVKAEYAGFQAQVKSAGEIAQAQADREKADRAAITKKQEAENAIKYKDLSDKYAAARRMLNANPGGGQAKPLSDAAPLISCSDRQADTAGRLERLEAGILNLTERGDKAIQRTIDCRNWLVDQQAVK